MHRYFRRILWLRVAQSNNDQGITVWKKSNIYFCVHDMTVPKILQPADTLLLLRLSTTFTNRFRNRKLSWQLCNHNNCLPRLWNSLPTSDLNQSVRCIKQKLKLFFWKYFVLHFNPDIPCTFHFVCPCNRCVALPISCNFHDDIL